MVAAPEPPYSPLKLHLSYPVQIGLLRARKLAINDEPAALAALQRIGYYRLVGYWFPLRKPDPNNGAARLDDFQDGATFELAVNLYDFDRALRLLVLDAIERIEVAIRVDVAYLLCAQFPTSDLVILRNGGFPDGWRDAPLWQTAGA